jgi:hypothetical protein
MNDRRDASGRKYNSSASGISADGERPRARMALERTRLTRC